ncbi:hypothetical protein [Sinomicrobium pectinilyticum]|uniref:T9SS C-terminal target domain-containing protein n=1 Tax=Sinomicrobium pectinilyticum TaxID=1084421 RepID=A0A3N0DQR9_SINP1|nr:hypothetical protein [Sinomicrobium pectinilyticum]RNL77975.1 hypothetical protein ED312_20135 [Sinomicrobium pectinilyticum]
MKRIVLILLLGLVFKVGYAQQTGIGTTTPDSSSVLDITATDKGILVPRIDLTSGTLDLDGQPGQATGLLIFNIGNTFEQGFYFWNGTEWKAIGGTAGNGSGGGEDPFNPNEIRSIRYIVPAADFIEDVCCINEMTGKSLGDTSNFRQDKSAYEMVGDSQGEPIIINGLRMDFLAYDATRVSPKLFNTTANAIVYNISSLSTNDAYIDGIGTTIASNHYNYLVDGDDIFGASPNGNGEYVNVMLTFDTGEWYQCTWFATQDANNFYLYMTAQRLN